MRSNQSTNALLHGVPKLIKWPSFGPLDWKYSFKSEQSEEMLREHYIVKLQTNLPTH